MVSERPLRAFALSRYDPASLALVRQPSPRASWRRPIRRPRPHTRPRLSGGPLAGDPGSAARTLMADLLPLARNRPRDGRIRAVPRAVRGNRRSDYRDAGA